MKILLTGCTGFIGTRLFQLLSDQKFDVIGLHRSGQIEDPRAIQMDLSDPKEMDALFKDYQFTHIIHNAATTDLSQGATGYQNNIETSNNLIQRALDKRVERFIFLSSFMVYGSSYLISPDEIGSAHPYEWYSESKALTEATLLSHAEYMEPIILRLPAITGPDQQMGGVIQDLVDELKKTGKITIWGNGAALRQFVDIEDTSNMILQCLDLKFPKGSILPLTGGEAISISELAETIVELWGSGEVIYDLEKPNSPEKWVDSNRTRKIFGEPRLSLKESLGLILERNK